RKLLRKRTIASGGSRPSVGKSLRKRQRSPQVGEDPKTCGLRRPVATEAHFPRRLACSRRSGFWPNRRNVTKSISEGQIIAVWLFDPSKSVRATEGEDQTMR